MALNRRKGPESREQTNGAPWLLLGAGSRWPLDENAQTLTWEGSSTAH